MPRHGRERRIAYQMRPPPLIRALSIIQLQIQVLINALQRPADADFILEFDRDFVVNERFEETAGLCVSGSASLSLRRICKVRCMVWMCE